MDMELSHSRESDLFLQTSTKASTSIYTIRVHSPESLEGLSERSCMEGVISQISALRD